MSSTDLPKSSSNGAITASSATTEQEIQEKAVGISVFVRSDAPGFTCVLKHRYTDFLVNEILPNGEVLHLADNSSKHDHPSQRKRKQDGEQDEESRKRQRADPQETHTETAPSAESGAHANGDAKTSSLDQPHVKDEAVAPTASVESVKEQAISSISDADKAILADVFDADTTSAILSLYASVIAHPSRKARDHATVKSQPLAEKSKRTEAHVCIRRIFSEKLETLTIQDQDHQSGPGTIISIRAAPPKSSAKPRNAENRGSETQRGKEAWSELGGEYLHFTLYKENKDTMEVLYFLASQLKLHIKHFSFAGTKDRRAVTVQRVAIHRIRRERIEALNRMSRGWRLGGPWEHRKEPLELGMLQGNEFLLTLREAVFEGQQSDWDMQRKLDHAQTLAKTAAESLSESGFLNYYGLQRFGTHSIGTHTVGMKMLQGDLKGAVDAILSYDSALLEENQPADGQDRKVPQDDISRATAIHGFYQDFNSTKALNRLPNRFSAERGLITHLGKREHKTGRRVNENDFQGALNLIQRNLRLMYVHAYQSFVWNTVVGKRFEAFGTKVMEGDLVVVGEKERHEGVTSTTAVGEEVDEDGEPIIHPSATAAAGTEDAGKAPSATDAPEDEYVRARPLSKAEAESGRYNVFDLVLPLPGFDVLYPRNEIGKLYEDFMRSPQGGDLDPHNMRRAWKDLSLPGSYRKMMARPLGNDLVVDVQAYGGPEDQLVETDLAKLKRESGKEISSGTDAANGHGEKDKIAVVLKLQLGSSQYATMALRELTNGGASGYRPNYSVANR